MFKENFVIKGELVCETGLHIGGSNDNIDIGGTDNVIIRDVVSDLPFIPGSSLKGKLRSLFELNDKESAQSVMQNKGGPATDGDSKAAKIFGVSADNNKALDFPTRLIVRDAFPTEESIELANQARLEQYTYGKVSVICPKCQEHPEIYTTPGGERTTITCKCGYIRNGEINF